MGAFSNAQIKRAVIDFTAATGVVVTPVAGVQMLVLELQLTTAAASVVAVTAGTGPIPLGVDGQIYAPFRERGHVKVVAGAGVLITNSAAPNQISGHLTYVELGP